MTERSGSATMMTKRGLKGMLPCRMQGKYLPNDCNFAGVDGIGWSPRQMDMLSSSPSNAKFKAQ